MAPQPQGPQVPWTEVVPALAVRGAVSPLRLVRGSLWMEQERMWDGAGGGRVSQGWHAEEQERPGLVGAALMLVFLAWFPPKTAAVRGRGGIRPGFVAEGNGVLGKAHF